MNNGPDIPKDAYRHNTDYVLSTLRSSPHGLTSAEASERISRYGLNKLPIRKPPSILTLFLRQLLSPFSVVLIIACLISYIFGDVVDTLVIFGALALDAGIGLFHEIRAQKTFDDLFTKATIGAIVYRDGTMKEIDASLLVPGDIIMVKYGDKVPADARIITSSHLQIDEALLTGESMPQRKDSKTIKHDVPLGDRANMLFTGTNTVTGSGKAIVTTTGRDTELGKISEFVTAHDQEKTHLQEEINKMSKITSWVLGVVIVTIFTLGIIRGNTLEEIIPESIALAVSAIPESLPVIITVIFAIGMKRIYSSKGLVKKLLATETLGRTEVLCVDKTGTLTQGTMTVEQIAFDHHTVEVKDVSIDDPVIGHIGVAATLCNQAFKDDGSYKGNPTDTALLKLGHSLSYTKESILGKAELSDFRPFDPEIRMSASLLSENDSKTLYICGAPEEILKKSTYIGTSSKKLSAKHKKSLLNKNEELGQEGSRIIGVAMKEEATESDFEKPSGMTFLSLLIISDPLRRSAPDTVRLAQRAGINLVMVTGDHPKTAFNIAKEVGIANDQSQVMTGKELAEISEKDLDQKIGTVRVFARVNPFDKVKIIEAWRRKDKIVAMTGDGVNDAPALKLADIGIALGSGTEVAKEAADIILLNDNLQTMLQAVREGRGILDNIRKVVAYLLSDTFAEVVLVGSAVVLGMPLPILPLQILWVNLVEDGMPDVALALEPVEKDVMMNSPDYYKGAIMDKEVRTIAFLISWIDDIVLLLIYFYFLNTGQPIEYIRTMVFAALCIDSLFFAYACKSLRTPIWKTKLFSNKLLNFSFLLGFALLTAALYLPFLQGVLGTVSIGATEWFVLILIGMIDLASIEIVKWIFFHKKHEAQLKAG